jgi:hypothetical protein
MTIAAASGTSSAAAARHGLAGCRINHGCAAGAGVGPGCSDQERVRGVCRSGQQCDGKGPMAWLLIRPLNADVLTRRARCDVS